MNVYYSLCFFKNKVEMDKNKTISFDGARLYRYLGTNGLCTNDLRLQFMVSTLPFCNVVRHSSFWFLPAVQLIIPSKCNEEPRGHNCLKRHSPII